MDHDEASQSSLQAKFARLLQRRREESKLRDLKASPAGSVDFSSNDFLSLATYAPLRNLFMEELDKATPQLGSTGSRLLDGNSTYSEDLERDIAAFHGGQAGLLANSGFDANVGLFSCLPQPGDIVIYDELIHASVHDGMRLSRASRTLFFAHNSVSDLGEKLETCMNEDPLLLKGQRSIFIAVESVYSMEGDLAPLREFVDLVEKLCPHGNAHIIVDEAHSTGIYGVYGKGRVCELGLESRIFVRLHTFGKALACNGAIILCTPLTRLYLINYARPLIYTTFMSHPSLAAIRASYTFMASGETQPLAKHLFGLVNSLYIELQKLLRLYDFDVVRDLVSIPAVCPESPIFALYSPHPRSLAQYCQSFGFVVRAVVPPTVPDGTERVRICLHAGNTENEVLWFVQIVKQWIDARLQGDPTKQLFSERPKL